MLQMQSLGDGNCLYNSEAIWLIIAHQQKKLAPLLQKNSNHFAKLMLTLGQQNPSIGLPKTLPELNNPKALEKAFDTFIGYITSNNNLDWVKLQHLLAKALRSFVVDTIQTDPQIKAAAISDLSVYIDGICESTSEINATQTDICALRIELSNHLQAYNPQATANAPKKLAQLKAFVEKELNQFIEQKIGASKEKKPKIVDFVKSELKKVVNESIKGSKKRAAKTLLEEAQAALIAHLSGVIENDIDDSSIALSAHFEGMTELQNAMKAKLSAPNLNVEQKKQAIKQWFFEKEAEGLKLYLNDEEGIAQDGIDAGEFEQKVLSAVLGHVIKVKCLDFLDDHNTRVVNGFKTPFAAKRFPKNSLVFDMEKLPGHWNVLLADTPANQKLIAENNAQRLIHAKEKLQEEVKDNQLEAVRIYGSYANHHKQSLSHCSVSEYCQIMAISDKDYQSGIKSKAISLVQNSKDEAKGQQQRDWTNYLMMLGTITTAFAVITSGLIWPLMLPLINTLFAKSLAGAGLMTISKFASITIFSGLCGYAVTEKLHVESEIESSKMVGAGILAKSQMPAPSVLSLFQTTKEKAKEASKDSPKPVTQSTVKPSARIS